MKKIILLTIVVITSISCNHSKNQLPEISGEMNDTIEEVQPVQQKPVAKFTASELSAFFTEQVSGTQIIVQSKDIGEQYNGLYCYFRLKNKKATGLRFHIQYWNEKYADVDSYSFNADGKNFNYTANKNSGGSGNSRIVANTVFYWYDDSVNKTDLAFLEAVSQGKNVTVSLIDRGTNTIIETLTLSEKEKLNISRTLQYYYALDGAVIPRKGMVNIRQ